MDNKEKLISEDLLKPENMIRLYASGAFPMAEDKTGHINWYMPETRCIIPLDNFNIPRSLKKTALKVNYEIRYDHDYLEVIKNCSNRKETWISEKLINAYRRLYKRGHLHTVETWIDNSLAGGLYGVTFRGAFFGESMFSFIPQASKISLMHLLQRLHDKNFVLLDVQYMTEHLKMFGAIEIDWAEYNTMLQESHLVNCEF
jgi:leucyl/phenylalanyl-tRNA--protein transferase